MVVVDAGVDVGISGGSSCCSSAAGVVVVVVPSLFLSCFVADDGVVGGDGAVASADGTDVAVNEDAAFVG